MPGDNLPINKTQPAASNAGDEISQNPPAKLESTAATAPPVVVSEAEVTAVTDTEKLSEQIEILSGEIQALEAKIERLMGNVSSTTEQIAGQISEASGQDEESKPVAPAVVKESVASQNASVTDTAESTPPSPVNDIYAKHLGTTTQLPVAKTDISNAELEENSSVIGTIGEVLIIFGVIIFFILLASPLIKGFLSTDIFDAIKAVGWPTVAISLFLSFVISLFVKGKTAAKVLSVVFFFIAAIMVIGVLGFDSALGPFQPIIAPIFEFYR